MSSTRCLLASVVLSGLALGLISADVLPGPMCLGLNALYRSNDCFNNQTSTLCQFMSFVLSFEMDGQTMCNEHVCHAPGQEPTHSCQFLCNPLFIDTRGLCPLGSACCKNTSYVPPADAPNSDGRR